MNESDLTDFMREFKKRLDSEPRNTFEKPNDIIQVRGASFEARVLPPREQRFDDPVQSPVTGSLCDTCSDNHTRLDFCQGPSVCETVDGPCTPPGTTDGDCNNVEYFTQSFTNPYSEPAVLVFDGWADDWLSVNGVPLNGETCGIKFSGRVCIQLDAGETITIGALNNFDPCVQLHGDVWICKGTDASAITP